MCCFEWKEIIKRATNNKRHIIVPHTKILPKHALNQGTNICLSSSTYHKNNIKLVPSLFSEKNNIKLVTSLFSANRNNTHNINFTRTNESLTNN